MLNNIFEAKDFYQKKLFNLEDKNTIIKIKGSGPGSLIVNWNDTNLTESTKANI